MITTGFFHRSFHYYSFVHVLICFVVLATPIGSEYFRFPALVTCVSVGPIALLLWCQSQAKAQEPKRFQSKQALRTILLFSTLWVALVLLQFVGLPHAPMRLQSGIALLICFLPGIANTLIYNKYFRWIDDQPP